MKWVVYFSLGCAVHARMIDATPGLDTEQNRTLEEGAGGTCYCEYRGTLFEGTILQLFAGRVYQNAFFQDF